MLLWQSVCSPAGVALEASHGRRTLPACRGTLGPFKSKACCPHRVGLVRKQNQGSYSPSQLSVKGRFVYANAYKSMVRRWCHFCFYRTLRRSVFSKAANCEFGFDRLIVALVVKHSLSHRNLMIILIPALRCTEKIFCCKV